MSRALKLSRFVRACFKVESQFHALNVRSTTSAFKSSLACSNYARSATRNRRLYTTGALPSEEENMAEAAPAVDVEVDKNGKRQSKNGKKEESLMAMLRRVDERVRMYGRIDYTDTYKLLKACKKGMSNEEAVMLIRCSGNLLVKKTQQQRCDLANRVWEKVKECCDCITIDMINAKLEIQLENNSNFNPTEELVSLQKNGITPNKTTFYALMAQYCKLGDVANANEILNHMKSKDWPIDLNCFHMLIEAHMKNGDTAAAEDIITKMSEQRLKPTKDTYTVMMKCHAERGDMDAVKHVMTAVVSKGIKIELRNAYDVILTLVQSGHSDKLLEACDIFISNPATSSEVEEGRPRGRRSYDYQDSLNLLHRMVALDCAKETHELIARMVSCGIVYENAVLSVAQTLIIQMINLGQKFETIMDFRDRVEKDGSTHIEEDCVTQAVLRCQNTEYAADFLIKLASVGFNIELHYTLPLFERSAWRKSVDELYKVTGVLTAANFGFSKTMRVLREHSYDNLIKLGQKKEEILEKYKEIGIPDSFLSLLQMTNLLKEGEFGEVVRMVEEGHSFPPKMLCEHIQQGLQKTKNFDDFFKMILAAQGRMQKIEIGNSIILENTVRALSNRSEDLKNFINGWIDKGIEFVADKNLEKFLALKIGEEELAQKLLDFNIHKGRIFESPLTKDINLDMLKSFKKEDRAKKEVKKKSEAPSDVAKKEVKKKSEASNPVAKEASQLLHDKKVDEFKKLLADLVEKCDLESLAQIKQLRMSHELKSSVAKKEFVAHIMCGKAKEYTLENIAKVLSLNVLNVLSEKEPELFAAVENELLAPKDDLKIVTPYAVLYRYYLSRNELEKINKLFEVNPKLKNKIHLGATCNGLRIEKREDLLLAMVDLHRDADHSRRISSPYSNLISLKCDGKDHQAALELYDRALADGLTFENIYVSTLRLLESLLKEKNQPAPWKEGDIEELVKKRNEQMALKAKGAKDVKDKAGEEEPQAN